MSSFAMFCCLAWNCEALICTAALHPQGTMGNVAVAQILRSRWGNLRSTELRRVATISSSNPALLETGQSTATSSREKDCGKKSRQQKEEQLTKRRRTQRHQERKRQAQAQQTTTDSRQE
jgi:tellurite resistance protein